MRDGEHGVSSGRQGEPPSRDGLVREDEPDQNDSNRDSEKLGVANANVAALVEVARLLAGGQPFGVILAWVHRSPAHRLETRSRIGQENDSIAPTRGSCQRRRRKPKDRAAKRHAAERSTDARVTKYAQGAEAARPCLAGVSGEDVHQLQTCIPGVRSQTARTS